MFDPMTVYPAELRALVGEGDSPVAAASCQLAFGADRRERSRKDLEDTFRFLPAPVRDQVVEASRSEPEHQPGTWEKALERVVDAVGGDLVKADPDQLIGGVSVSGRAGSCAYRFASVLESGSFQYVVVSHRRLIIAEHDLSSGAYTALASVPRGAVIRVRRRGRFLQRGRVVLDFVDLSQLALMTGLLSTRAANRIVAAAGG